MSVFNQVEGFVKKNKRLVAAGGLGGAFLLLKSKGGGGGAAVIDGSQAAILPVATSPNENIDNTDTSGDGSFPSDDTTTLNPEPEPEPEPEPHDVLDPSSPEPEPEPEPHDSPAPVTAAAAPASGISIAGKSFPGATGRQQVGASNNAYGKYTIWLVSYPSKSERWYHYYADEKGKAKDKWTGPHNSTGNSAPVSHTPAPAPSPAPRPVSSSPQPSKPAAPAPAPAKEQPHMGANIFYNSDRNLRYIIQRHDNKKNYRHYESRLNKGDWGSGGVIPA